GYKNILNIHYDPDAYLFFVDGEDVIPLVVKNNFVTFFGGTRYNEAHTLPNNKALLNGMLSYLKKENYCCHFTSIKKDLFDLLEESNKYFDVPYPVEWHYKEVQHYNIENIIEDSGKRMRKRLKFLRNRIHDYTFKTLSFAEFKAQFSLLIEKHINYFSERGKESGWRGNENFLLELLTYFNKEENLLIRLIKLKQDIVGVSVLVYNNEEMIFYFASSLKNDNNDISQIIYLDILEVAKEISTGTNITQLNAMRGTTVNKKRFGFTPVPFYALVKDENWIVKADSDVDPESYKNVYGRSIWGRRK
ncbi:MAG: hypothetical protein KAI79_09260, partial [Bacteroidales bacterium]|nr:hypothetical protein [Bacteroidales bacterium]